MSADNWEVCPSCREQFPMSDDGSLRTFREDYEFWVDGAVVKASYSGWCDVCGSGVSFKDERPIEMKRLRPKVPAASQAERSER